ncbi:MAG: 4Fe-4S binding protein [Deltaproteobacteria bacterium]|nr:4Fe-4S binding protein [Deltaproteobacteria bacterium]
MYPTKSALVYFSPTGTTKAVLGAIAEGLGLPTTHIDATLPAHRAQDHELDADTLLVLGFPVYYGRVPLIQEEILPRLHGDVRYALPVVVYGNRAYEDSLRELGDLCRQKGYALAAAAVFIAEHSYSTEMGTKRPDDVDRALARHFGAEVMISLKAGKTLDCDMLPGNVPYRTYGPKPPIVPETNEACIACNECVGFCPTGAIASEDRSTDVQRCILCAACIKKCPCEAKFIGFAPMQERIRAMAAANREPKQPRLFLPE